MNLLITIALLGLSNVASASDFKPVKIMMVGQIADGGLPLNVGVNHEANPNAPEMLLSCYGWSMDFNLYEGEIPGKTIWGDIEPNACWALQKALKKSYKQNKTSCIIEVQKIGGLFGKYPELEVADESECQSR